jgi:flagellar biosynthesis/type III secretory pathway chaperone
VCQEVNNSIKKIIDEEKLAICVGQLVDEIIQKACVMIENKKKLEVIENTVESVVNTVQSVENITEQIGDVVESVEKLDDLMVAN